MKMAVFRKNRKRNFRSLKKLKQLRRKKEETKFEKLNNENILDRAIKTFLISERGELRYQEKGEKVDEFPKENHIVNIKKCLFKNENIITEKDLIDNCVLFDTPRNVNSGKMSKVEKQEKMERLEKMNKLKKISYLILYTVLKKTIDHENVLMKIEELGFSMEKIRNEEEEDINICLKYKSSVFFSYIYKNLQMIKQNKNFQVLCKLLKVVLSLNKIMPYLFKIKLIFCFCSLFNIYQKKLNEQQNETNKEYFYINENEKKGKTKRSLLLGNVDHNSFLNLFFEVMTKLSTLQKNYNDYDKSYTIFNFFVVRWLLIYFKNKSAFFINRKGTCFILCRYIVLLFHLLQQCHDTADFKYSQESASIPVNVPKPEAEGILINNNYNNTDEMLMKRVDFLKEEEEYTLNKDNSFHSNGNFFKNELGEPFPSFPFSFSCDNKESNLLNDLCTYYNNCPNDKIKKTKKEIQEMIEIFYSKVNIRLEKNMKEVEYSINNLTSSIFLCIYNLFQRCDLLHKHLILSEYACSFLKLHNLDYSYYILFNCFQFMNKLLTIENVAIHPILFVAIRETFTFCEKVIIYLYKKKNDINEEFYQFCENFHTKHNKLYSGLIKRVWNLYTLIISEEFLQGEKKVDKKLESGYEIGNGIEIENGAQRSTVSEIRNNSEIGIGNGNGNGNETLEENNNNYNNYNNNNNIYNNNNNSNYGRMPKYKAAVDSHDPSFLKIDSLDFSDTHKEFLLEKIDNTYKNILTSCLAKAFRVIGLSFFFDEMYFFSNAQLLKKDIFYINKIIADTSKSYNGGNFKFLMNFFYPLLNFYINLYEQETCIMKKEHFFGFMKVVLIYFTRCLNDCINLYYFMSTNIEDLFILVSKLLSCTNYELLQLFLRFFQHIFISTLKVKQEDVFYTTGFFDLSMINGINVEYTKINFSKNEFFLNNISEHLLKLVLPKYIEILSKYMKRNFSSVKTDVKNIAVTINEYARLIYLCAHFISPNKLEEAILMIEQYSTYENIKENDIYMLLCFLNIVTILVHFFFYNQICTCCNSIYCIFLLTKNQWRRNMLLTGNGLTGNGLTGNGLTGNGLTGNGLTGNGLTGNGLTGNGLTQNMVTQNMVTQNIVTQNMATQNMVTQNMVTQNMVTQNALTQNSENGELSAMYTKNTDVDTGTSGDNRQYRSSTITSDCAGYIGSTSGGDAKEREIESQKNMARLNLNNSKNNWKKRKLQKRQRAQKTGAKETEKTKGVKETKDLQETKDAKEAKETKSFKKVKKVFAFKKTQEGAGHRNTLLQRLNKMRKNKNRKEQVEKLTHVQVLIFGISSRVFKIFGNVLYKMRMGNKYPNKTNITNITNIKNRKKEKRDKQLKMQDKCVHLEKKELQIFNTIYVDGYLVEKNFPIMLQRNSIILFFENAEYLKKYTKNLYRYVNNFTYFLSECVYIDYIYAYNLFYDILPRMMKTLFWINKSFSNKFQKNQFFENIVNIGKWDLTKFLNNITPGLLIEDPLCQRIAIHILYVLINKYTLDREKQKKILDVFVTLATTSQKNSFLKIYVKFLLVCVSKFHMDIVYSYLTNITSLINTLSYKSFKYVISKFVLKLRDVVIEEEKRIQKEEQEEDEEKKENENENEKEKEKEKEKDFINSLTKTNRVLLRKALEEKEKTKENIEKSQHKKKRKKENESDVSDLELTDSTSSCSSDYSSNISISSYLNENENETKENATKEKVKMKKKMKLDKRKRLSILKKKLKDRKQKKVEYNNWNILINNLKNSKTNEERKFIENLLNRITQLKEKNKKDTEYNRNILSVFRNLQSGIFNKQKGALSMSSSVLPFGKEEKKKTVHVWDTSLGKNKKMKIEKKEKKENKKNVTDSEEEEEKEKEEDVIKFNDEGKMVISIMPNKLSSKNEKKRDIKDKDAIKQSAYSKLELNKRNRQKKKESFITKDKSAYKSKKGKGDIIKKNQLLPYSYIALKPVMAKEKFRRRVLNTFQSIKGPTKGRQ